MIVKRDDLYETERGVFSLSKPIEMKEGKYAQGVMGAYGREIHSEDYDANDGDLMYRFREMSGSMRQGFVFVPRDTHVDERHQKAIETIERMLPYSDSEDDFVPGKDK